MKKILFILLVLLFVKVQSQERKNDTLFIKYDETLLKGRIDPDNKTIYNYVFVNQRSKERSIHFEKRKTFRDLTTSSTIKTFEEIYKEAKINNDYIAAKLFRYFDEHKYSTYFLVKGNEFIEMAVVDSIICFSEEVPYINGNVDTLLIKYNEKLLIKKQLQNDADIRYCVSEKKKPLNYMYFKQKAVFKDLKAKLKPQSLKKLLTESKAYKNHNLHDAMFENYLRKNFGTKCKYFFVKDNVFIQVEVKNTLND
ncbi:protein of unknown function [Tenacibaculum sp. 190130A14a]|uniref:GLPGLI family protein n=1 Tax=Tenacibaculum polynesiense TaxID=3137857 RepID=A0ABP1EVM8_9FLAO